MQRHLIICLKKNMVYRQGNWPLPMPDGMAWPSYASFQRPSLSWPRSSQPPAELMQPAIILELTMMQCYHDRHWFSVAQADLTLCRVFTGVSFLQGRATVVKGHHHQVQIQRKLNLGTSFTLSSTHLFLMTLHMLLQLLHGLSWLLIMLAQLPCRVNFSSCRKSEGGGEKYFPQLKASTKKWKLDDAHTYPQRGALRWLGVITLP